LFTTISPITSAQITVLLALSDGLFDKVPLDRMPDAEQAVRHAAAEIPAQVNERLDAAKKLSGEDRMTIIDIARAALGEYLPEVMGRDTITLRALLREYLFVSLYRACAESLASENASRLAAMQRAEKNIDELLEGLNGSYHRLRQSGIDEELFDVISGFEALSPRAK